MSIRLLFMHAIQHTAALSEMRADAEKASELPHYEVGTRKRNKIWI